MDVEALLGRIGCLKLIYLALALLVGGYLVPDGMPPALITVVPRQRTGDKRGSAVPSVGLTAHSRSSGLFISAPLGSYVRLSSEPAPPTHAYIYRVDSLCRLCPRSPIA